MNVLSVSEMFELENILSENPFRPISSYKNLKPYQKSYLLRAKRLPLELINKIIEYYKENNLDKKLLISYLSSHFSISEKDAETRIREVKKINRYNLEKSQKLVLRQNK